jgi:hypothetical protein
MILNFTQFCIRYGFPCDHDTMFEAQLLGSRGLAGRTSKRAIRQQDDAAAAMRLRNREAHRLFEEAILNGEIVDATGKITREKLMAEQAALERAATNTKIRSLESRIRSVYSLGAMSHTKAGKLKRAYQADVDRCREEIDRLKKEQSQ